MLFSLTEKPLLIPDTTETNNGLYSPAENRTRTDDPFITSEVLYQLSYFGIWSSILTTFVIISRLDINFNHFFINFYGLLSF